LVAELAEIYGQQAAGNRQNAAAAAATVAHLWAAKATVLNASLKTQ